MVVQVVSEGLDVVDGLLSLGSGNVGLEQHERDVSVSLSNLQISDSLELHGRLLLRIGNRGSIRHGSSGVLVFLQEDLGEDDIVQVLELDRKDDNASIRLGLEEKGLIVSVSDLDQLTGLLGLDVGKDRVKGSRKSVSLHQSDLSRELGAILRGRCQIDLDSDIVASFRGGKILAVLLLHDLVGTKLLEFAVTFDRHRDKEQIL